MSAERIVFNIKRNDNRLVVAVDFETGIVWSKWTDTHKDYDRMDVLATLVDAHENERYPMGPRDPIEAIKFRMEQRGLTRKHLEGILGARTRVAGVLTRRRGLSLNMIRRPHEKLGTSADVLIRPSRTHRAA